MAEQVSYTMLLIMDPPRAVYQSGVPVIGTLQSFKTNGSMVYLFDSFKQKRPLQLIVSRKIILS